jgi:hypothetical protein
VRRRIFLVILLVAGPVVMFGTYVAYLFWDISNLKSACRALKPGTTIAEARKILADHRFTKDFPFVSKEFPNGIPAEVPGTWYFAIAAASTMGDDSCGITHDGTRIVSAEASEG